MKMKHFSRFIYVTFIMYIYIYYAIYFEYFRSSLLLDIYLIIRFISLSLQSNLM